MSAPSPIDIIEMFVEVLAPQVHSLVFVIEDPDTVLGENRRHLLDIATLFPSKRQGNVVVRRSDFCGRTSAAALVP